MDWDGACTVKTLAGVSYVGDAIFTWGLSKALSLTVYHELSGGKLALAYIVIEENKSTDLD